MPGRVRSSDILIPCWYCLLQVHVRVQVPVLYLYCTNTRDVASTWVPVRGKKHPDIVWSIRHFREFTLKFPLSTWFHWPLRYVLSLKYPWIIPELPQYYPCFSFQCQGTSCPWQVRYIHPHFDCQISRIWYWTVGYPGQRSGFSAGKLGIHSLVRLNFQYGKVSKCK